MSSIKVVLMVIIAALALASLGDQQAPEPQPKRQKAIECRWSTGTINFDGVLSEAAWGKAQQFELRVPWENRPAKTTTTARLLWDAEFLYFSAEMEDHDLYADVQKANGPVWENDSLALYFKPNTQIMPLGYYEFQVNAANALLQVFHPSRGGGGHKRFANAPAVQLEWISKLRGTLNVWVDKDKDWVVEGRISWASFGSTGGRPKPGDRWGFTLARRDYSVTLELPELSASGPLTAPDFHRYEEYQELVFLAGK